jgi:uncharacterized protein YggE
MMNIKKVLAAAIMLLFMAPVYGQVSAATEEKPYIEVIGTAEQEVTPDEICIDIDIRESKTKSAAEQEEKLKAVIKDLGISPADLSLTDALSNFARVSQKSGTLRIGKSYVLKVKEAATVAQLFYRLDKEDIAEAHIGRVDYSGMDALRKTIRIKAIKAAKDKADYLLDAIGSKTGKPLVIHEQEVQPYEAVSNIRNRYAANTTFDEYQGKFKQEVEFQRIKVRSSIYIKFAIQ